ncbi:MAG: carbohydrate kinase family protein [Ignavibacteriaceae bacterium]|nr:carbohydrate kinase family protein [Ignavibacteriaceae bacterium]
MKLLIIGHSVVDIIDKDGDKVVQPGGIFYSVNTCLQLISPNDEIYLCTQIDDKHFHLYENVYKNVDQSFIERVDAIPAVELTVSGHFERKEHYKNISNKLNIDCGKLNDFDGILINMITGFDIDIIQLQKTRQSTNALIYFDVHTLSRGLDENLHRSFRVIPDFDEWAKNIDIIQCNEHEIFTLSDKKTEIEIVEHLFNCGIKIVCITKGKIGSKIYYKNKNEVASYFRSTRKISNNNNVGCGDVFGAAFFYGYISTGNITQAAELSASSSEYIASINNLSEFIKLKENVVR